MTDVDTFHRQTGERPFGAGDVDLDLSNLYGNDINGQWPAFWGAVFAVSTSLVLWALIFYAGYLVFG